MSNLCQNFLVKKAHKTQTCLSKNVVKQDRLPYKICTVGGVDVAYVGEIGVGAVTVLDYNTLEILETGVATRRIRVPYIPTLLSFREISPAMAAIRKLKHQPDILLVDAQGYAHPYRCGFASHLGLVLKKPTVGAAKSRLIGQEVTYYGRTPLIDKGETVGEVVSTKEGAKPIYVSIGHMVSIETSVEIIKYCSKGRIPQPLLLAHNLATRERNRLAGEKVNI